MNVLNTLYSSILLVFSVKNRINLKNLLQIPLDEVELLGLTIDKELNFSKHIDKLCRNTQYKLHALKRIRKYLSLGKAKMSDNAFIDYW